MAPAILMLIVAVLTTGLRVISIPVYIFSPPPLPSGVSEGDAWALQVILVTLAFVSLVFNIVVIAGTVQMLRLRNFNLARATAILACLSCSEFCVNVIFGVWILIVLHLPNVRKRFR